MGWLDRLRTALDAHLSVDGPGLPQMLARFFVAVQESIVRKSSG